MKLKEMEASKTMGNRAEIDKLNYPYCAIFAKILLGKKDIRKIAVDLYFQNRTCKRLKIRIEKILQKCKNEIKIEETQ